MHQRQRTVPCLVSKKVKGFANFAIALSMLIGISAAVLVEFAMK